MNASPMNQNDETKLNDYLPKHFDLEFRCGSIRVFRSKDLVQKAASCFNARPKCPEGWNPL